MSLVRFRADSYGNFVTEVCCLELKKIKLKIFLLYANVQVIAVFHK